MTPQQQAQYNAELFKERDKHVISWNNELREWYPLAIAALTHVSVRDLQVPMKLYDRLLQTELQGVNLNIFGCLCNGLESVAPGVMGYTPADWGNVMRMNANAVDLFLMKDAECHMIVSKRFELAGGRPVTTGGLKLIKGEA